MCWRSPAPRRGAFAWSSASGPGWSFQVSPVGSSPDTAVTHTYEWGPPRADGAIVGTWSTEIRGASLATGGTSAIRPEGDGAVHLYNGRNKASVPVMGGRLEVLALDNLRRGQAHHERRPAFTGNPAARRQ